MTRRPFPLPALLAPVLLTVAACGGEMPPQSAQGLQQPIEAPPPAGPGRPAPAAHGDAPVVVLDLRENAPPLAGGRGLDALAAAFPGGVPAGADARGLVQGHFTEAGRPQQAALVARGSEATLLVLEGETVVARLPVPAPYDAGLAAAHDLDGDGRDELLLRSERMDGARTVTGVAVVAIEDGALRMLEQYPRARVDACAGDAGPQRVMAGAFHAAEGGLDVRMFAAPCSEAGAPALAAFEAL
ncbi:hypothetical protein [Coralloluteibacterium thermophilus]|uniref:VCBS repeat-containing protein n=1 Tax=Coralloluteibacterium thermophilum TaxID=2707049 RepID=A0ABV9NQ08_9GAMM